MEPAERVAKYDSRPIRSFHARRGRVRPSAAAALTRLWPDFGIDFDDRLSVAQVFSGYDTVVLEIGCGMGEAAIEFASTNPETGLLAVDVHRPGLGVLLREIDRHSIENVRVASIDAVELLQRNVESDYFDEIRTFFPDPWPKLRHHKRRLIQGPFTELAVSRLRPGGRLHLATDWAPYADQMMHVIKACDQLTVVHDDYSPRPADRTLTRFERKGIDKGHEVFDIIATKIVR